MMVCYDYLLISLLFIVMTCHVLLSPFTKVEESFNVQAIHDVIYHNSSLSQYDHLEFPGVVPRTFIGPLTIVSIAYTPLKIIQYLSNSNKMTALICVRLCLGALVCMSFCKFVKSVGRVTNTYTARIMMLLAMTQFHFLFYASRPLPNTFALILVLLAVAAWLDDQYFAFIFYSAVAIIVFRIEVAILLGILLLFALSTQNLHLIHFIVYAVVAGVFAIFATVLVDSYFWQHWIWPEGQVAYYNLILNKSSDWGTLPFWWYFYSALPRATLSAFILCPCVLLYDSFKIRALFAAGILFVLIYSFLPHKELRFVVYVFPIINMAAAAAINLIQKAAGKNLPFGKLLSVIAIFSLLICNIFASFVFVMVSKDNYPGGVALTKLHEIEDSQSFVSVHIDNLALQTGVSRFSQQHSHWIYSKTDALPFNSVDELKYTHLIREAPCDKYHTTHDNIYEVDAFDHIKMEKAWIPFSIYTRNKLCILKQKK